MVRNRPEASVVRKALVGGEYWRGARGWRRGRTNDAIARELGCLWDFSLQWAGPAGRKFFAGAARAPGARSYSSLAWVQVGLLTLASRATAGRVIATGDRDRSFFPIRNATQHAYKTVLLQVLPCQRRGPNNGPVDVTALLFSSTFKHKSPEPTASGRTQSPNAAQTLPTRQHMMAGTCYSRKDGTGTIIWISS